MNGLVSKVCPIVALMGLVACSSDDDGSNLPASTSSGGAGGQGSGGSSAGGSSSVSGGSSSGGSSSGGGPAGAAGEGGAPGCTSPGAADIAVAGTYVDNYDGSHRIADEAWVMGDSVFHVLEFSNKSRTVIAANDQSNEYFPGDYSRFDWATVNGELYFCQTAYAAGSADAARNTMPADASDLTAGCGGFPWSALNPIALVGSYMDNWDGPHTIDAASWQSGGSVFHFVEISNAKRWAIAQNDCENPYFPGLYSRFDWTESTIDTDGAAGAAGAGGAGSEAAIYFCQTGYDLESATAAAELDPADADNLESGCNGFSWSALSAADL